MHRGKSPLLQQRICDLCRQIIWHRGNDIAQISHPRLGRRSRTWSLSIAAGHHLIITMIFGLVIQAENMDCLRVRRASQKVATRRKAQAVNCRRSLQAASKEKSNIHKYAGGTVQHFSLTLARTLWIHPIRWRSGSQFPCQRRWQRDCLQQKSKCYLPLLRGFETLKVLT